MRMVIADPMVPLDIAGENPLFQLRILSGVNCGAIVVFRTKICRVNALIICSPS